MGEFILPKGLPKAKERNNEMSDKYKRRLERVKGVIWSNKIFVIMAIIVIIFLVSNFLFKSGDSPEQPILQTHENQEDLAESDNPETENTAPPKAHEEGFRFYLIDLIIFVIGGSFCVIMILRERKKTKNKL